MKRDNSVARELLDWVPIVIMLIIFWPVGLFLMYRKLKGYFILNGRSAPRQQVQPGTQGVREQPRDSKGRYVSRRKPVDLKKGKKMTVIGAVVAGIFGFAALNAAAEFIQSLMWGYFFPDELMGVLTLLGITGGGLVAMAAGRQRQKKSKRFNKYLSLIGSRESISVASLAQAMPVSVRVACDDLQDMLDEGILPQGYLDMSSGHLVLGSDGLEEKPVEEKKPEPERKSDDDDAILLEIRRVNDAIDDPVMSAKIDRIGEITGKILAYQRSHPDKAGQLRSFLSYYLPTTLKILNAYAQMEAQGISGENINSAKQRIEGMMDKVVEGFENQLDKLFADSAMDITTDVEVLEKMLSKDGLSSDQLTMEL